MKLAVEWFEGLRIALDAIRANKLRAALATLGIVIGVVTVTLMGTAIEGLRTAFLQSISALSADVLYVTRIPWMTRTYEDWIKVSSRPSITLAEVRELRSRLTLARAVAPFIDTRQPVRYRNRRADGVTVIGSTHELELTSGITVATGRFLTAEESEGGRPVAVLGSQVATNLFPHGEGLGEIVRIGGIAFEVVGTLASQGSFMGEFNLDNQVIVPIRQFQSAFRRWPDFQLQVKAADMNRIEEARDELYAVMRRVRRLEPGDPENFSINQQETIIATFNRLGAMVGVAGLFITSLSLFVGGIGIMNIMFVSVAERTREIGIRKAIGAKRRSILIQFLLEAAGICLFGGLVALAIAWPATWAMQKVLPAKLSLVVVAIALGVSVVTGVLAGFLPAWRAAKLDPVEALRHE